MQPKSESYVVMTTLWLTLFDQICVWWQGSITAVTIYYYLETAWRCRSNDTHIYVKYNKKNSGCPKIMILKEWMPLEPWSNGVMRNISGITIKHTASFVASFCICYARIIWKNADFLIWEHIDGRSPRTDIRKGLSRQ